MMSEEYMLPKTEERQTLVGFPTPPVFFFYFWFINLFPFHYLKKLKSQLKN